MKKIKNLYFLIILSSLILSQQKNGKGGSLLSDLDPTVTPGEEGPEEGEAAPLSPKPTPTSNATQTPKQKEEEDPKQPSVSPSSVVVNNISNVNPETPTLLSKVHEPALDVEDSDKSKLYSIVTIVIFGLAYMIFDLVYAKSKNINRFFSKCMESLSNQLMFMIICFLAIVLFYSSYTFDSIKINWQYYIAGFAIFLLSWLVFNIFISILSVFFVKNWNYMEQKADNFANLRHQFEEFENDKYDQSQQFKYNSKEASKVKKLYEYLVLKRFFFIPLFPLFKASSLRKEMNFAVYLEKCLQEKIRKYFNFSWTSWILMIVTMMFWNVFISHKGPIFLLVYLCLIPLLGIGFSLAVYLYLRSIYRKVVDDMTQNNMLNFQDVEYNSNAAMQSLGFPNYLLKLIQNPAEMDEQCKQKFTIHEHIHQRPPSLYEDLMIFGASGFSVLLNLIQATCLCFISWLIITFAYHMEEITDYFSKLIIIIFVMVGIIYFGFQGYLASLCIKWFTIVDSIEMRRNEECVKKLVNSHMLKCGQISENIFRNFKKIYFDMKTSNKETPQEEKIFLGEVKEDKLQLTYNYLQDLIKMGIFRFTETEREDAIINVKENLEPFLKSIGNNLNGEEIEFMLHLIKNFTEFKGELTINDFYDICGAILHFRQKKPFEIVNYVFQNYFSSGSGYNKEEKITYKIIETFMNTYHNFFSKQETDFMIEQTRYLGDKFTLDALMGNLLSLRQYYPY